MQRLIPKPFLENLWRDLLYGARGLRRNPALVFTAMVSLALGIGVNTAMFSLGVEFLLSEPSVSDSRSVVSVRLGGSSHAKPRVIDLLRESNVFQEVAAENEETFINWNDGSETRRIFSVVTTKNYFTALGVPMAFGRGYALNDPNEVAVLSNRFWRTRFHGDPAVVGRSINLDGRFYTVLGILPAGHRTLIGFGFSPDVYLPRFLDDTNLAIYARLKPGMTLQEARAGLLVAAERLDAAFPAPQKYAVNLKVAPIAGFARLQQESEMFAIGIFFVLLLLVVGLVLLIACVNVASLLLARASTRRREIAIRLSLGASRFRLLQQLLVESLLLSVLGAASGFALAQFTVTLLANVPIPLPVPMHIQVNPDWRVVSYAAFLTILATVACGLLPAWQSLKESLTSDIHLENRFRMRRTLVAVQIAISVIVLTTGVLFLRNLLRSTAISPGFDVRQTLRAEVNLPPVAYKNAERMTQYVDQALRSLAALPGIESVAAARVIPFTDSVSQGTMLRFSDGGEGIQAGFQWNAVTPAYFQTMDITILRGRTFLPSDRAGVQSVIVNRTFAERYSSNREAVGRTFLWKEGKTLCQIVGVVEDTKNLTIGEEAKPQLYQSLAQIGNTRTRIQFVLRSQTPPATQLDAVRRELRRIEPGAGTEVATLYSSIGLAFFPSQVGGALLGSMGILGLVLAAVGLYGVMAYSVARRTREIGLRMAIGANRSDISRMVFLDSARLIAIGSAVGLFVAFFVTRPLSMFLVPGLEPSDPVSFLAVVIALLITGLLATWGPVRRAVAIDPMVSLRNE